MPKVYHRLASTMSKRQFVYLRSLGQTYNVNIVVKDSESGTLWVGKISRTLTKKGVDFRDLNSRALLAERLAKLVDHPLVHGRIISSRILTGFDVSTVPDRIDDTIFLTPISGKPLPTFLQRSSISNLKNPEAILANFVFNAWIGNHDRKDADYIVAQDRRVTFIDYQLCGPGFIGQPLAAIGAYAEAYSLDQVEDLGWCLGTPGILSHVREHRYTFSDFAPMIERIQMLSRQIIRQALRGLVFTDEKGNHLSKIHVEHFLRQRQSMLAEAVQRWVAAGYPRGQRPVDPAHNDSLYPDANDR